MNKRVLLVMLAFLLTVAVFVLAADSEAQSTQVTRAWLNAYPGQMAVGVVTDANGNIYVAGPSFADVAHNGSEDMVLQKFSLAGNRLWVREFDETADSTWGQDVPSWMTLDPSGNVLITGQSYLYPSGDTFMTWKYDPNGNLLWTHRHIFGRGTRVATDSYGNVYVTGINTNTQRTDYITFKLGPAGNTLWTRTYNGPSDWIDSVTGLAVRPDGRVAVTGNSEGGMVTIVYDTNGNELWRRTFSSPDPFYILSASDVIFGPNGEVYVGGSYLIKYDANGNQLWVRPEPVMGVLPGPVYRLRLDPSGNIVAIGDFSPAGVAKFSPNGTRLWAQTFTSPNNNAGGLGNLSVGSDGAVYVTGTSEGGILTVKYDANGNVQWKDLYDHTAFDLDAGNAIALDSQGHVIVAGQRPILTVRYVQGTSSAPTPTPTITATPVTAPTPTPTPVPNASIHVGDLDRSAAKSSNGTWRATVTILVHSSNESPVAGVRVSGAWSGGYTLTASCTTNTSGLCSITSGTIRYSSTSATFRVNSLTKSGYTYSAAANHDPDRDSNGTKITVYRP